MNYLHINFPTASLKNNGSHFKVVESHFDIQKAARVLTIGYLPHILMSIGSFLIQNSLLHISIFTLHSICIRCMATHHGHPIPLARDCLRVGMWPDSGQCDMKGSLWGPLWRYRMRHAHLFTCWMFLGPDVMAEIAPVTMLPKSDAISWENK